MCPSDASPGHPESGQPGRHRSVLVVTCLALATVVAAMASLNVALPDIARDTRASQTDLSWIIAAYSLVFASLLLLAGTLGDRYGRRKALLGGLALFAAVSAAATFTRHPGMLITLRAVLGLAAAFVMPATLSTITTTFPRELRARAVSVWAAVAGASAVLGLLASGLVLEVWSWRSVFWLNVLMAGISLIGTLVLVPESAEPGRHDLDGTGAVLTVVGLGVLVYSVIEAPDHGWGSPRTLAGIAAGLSVLSGFVFWELRHRHPLLDPRLFRRPRLAAGALSVALQFFAFFGFVFVFMQYLQLVRGDSALVAAVAVLPMAATMIPSTRLSPRLIARHGSRASWVVGLAGIAVGLAILALLGPASSYWLIVAGLLPLGAGMGLAMAPATAAITETLPPSQQNVGSAVNDLSRELGSALGIAVLSSVLASVYRTGLAVRGLPPPVAHEARSSLAAAYALRDPAVITPARDAFSSAMRAALLTGAGAALLAALTVALLLRPSPRRKDQPRR